MLGQAIKPGWFSNKEAFQDISSFWDLCKKVVVETPGQPVESVFDQLCRRSMAEIDFPKMEGGSHEKVFRVLSHSLRDSCLASFLLCFRDPPAHCQSRAIQPESSDQRRFCTAVEVFERVTCFDGVAQGWCSMCVYVFVCVHRSVVLCTLLSDSCWTDSVVVGRDPLRVGALVFNIL